MARGEAWGRGLYFAENASYSHDYSWRINGGQRTMMYTLLLTGEETHLPNDRSIGATSPFGQSRAIPTARRFTLFTMTGALVSFASSFPIRPRITCFCLGHHCAHVIVVLQTWITW
jgi:hypothetical protein